MKTFDYIKNIIKVIAWPILLGIGQFFIILIFFPCILGIKLFFFGIFLNELVLGINGILSIKYISLPYSQYILFGISILIMLSLLLVFVFTKKNISQKSGKY